MQRISSRVQINDLNIGIDKLHMTKNAPKRIHDVAPDKDRPLRPRAASA